VLDDGSAGLAAVKAHGGRTLVQDPEEALYAGMPTSAIELVEPDAVLSARDLGRTLVDLAAAPPPDPPHGNGRGVNLRSETVVEVDRGASEAPHNGHPTGFSCPECSGGIWESVENGHAVFRCRTGHEFAPQTFVALQQDEVERALWTALRAIEEQAAMHRRLAERVRGRGSTTTAARFEQRADEGIDQAIVIRELLDRLTSLEEAS
jgi:two-component system chemotaxis response regulator CheB